MFLVALFLTTLVLHQTIGEDTNFADAAVGEDTNQDTTPVAKVEGKDLDGGFPGYGDRYSGYSRYSHGAKSYSQGYHGGFGNKGYGGYDDHHGHRYGGRQGGRHYADHHEQRDEGHYGKRHQEHRQEHKLVPIKIPYLDRNGCRFPGDVVCNTAVTTTTTYRRCVLSNENKNLWKKPSMTFILITCPGGTNVFDEFCNDNERILKAVGLIEEKEKDSTKYFHIGKYSVRLDPCLLQ